MGADDIDMAGRRAMTIVVTVVALLAAACGGSGTGGTEVRTAAGEKISAQPTAVFLSEAGSRTSDSTSFRFTAGFAMTADAGFFSLDLSAEDFMRGAQSGDAAHIELDMAPLFEDIAESFGDLGADPATDALLARADELTMEMYTAADTIYLRAPMLSVLAEVDPVGTGALPAGIDGWMKIDGSALGGATGSAVAAGLAGGQATDPSDFVAVLDHLSDEVRLVGTEPVDGIATEVLEAWVTLADFAEASGQSADDLLGSMAMGTEAGSVYERLLYTPVKVRANVDGAGMIRRLVVDIDLGQAMADAMGDSGLGAMEMTMSMWMDFSDFGADVDVTPPADATSTAVDASEWFGLMASGGTLS